MNKDFDPVDRLRSIGVLHSDDTIDPKAVSLSPGPMIELCRDIADHDAKKIMDELMEKYPRLYRLFRGSFIDAGLDPKLIKSPIRVALNQIVKLVFPKLICLLLYVVISSPASAGEQLLFIHQDHLGSAALTTDISGKLISKQNYFTYGTTRNKSGSIFSEKQYTGQISDQDSTGLYYYNARYYNPQIGKFTQSDSAGYGSNLYAYVNNDPVNLVDPSGNKYCDPEDYYCRHASGRD
ncbi:MAG: Wall associated protein [Candidatus Amesbacteria bacterium GW2011_GWB1_47_19]|nr:MAG: Wall associated protein [Candidatus Amesbacteria bacterium GW2011_GWA1_44_24]KKU31030.1 MAG: Wall associated protein [Candidatus Amesbacteria bacterium GW2011_GWC1_46_24]KKU65922.1 MAG: Wall associated protein [Candidatus Amesbacteria bacterium GW2011_GWB1_47_19]OGD05544.1 MAG: hypothetical protein A2379_01125 [Candidatus Amesbacteria bacterium RIFOXYB1_FULL_47_13]HBC73063.1 hypothetical protein [Candidatus Amesbacteria bacterium]